MELLLFRGGRFDEPPLYAIDSRSLKRVTKSYTGVVHVLGAEGRKVEIDGPAHGGRASTPLIMGRGDVLVAW